MYELQKRKIFRGKRDFSNVYNRGRSYINNFIVMYVVKSKGFNGKIGFAAGKKLGGAVVRNRVKRLLREAYRLYQHEIRKDVALILIGRKPLTTAKYDKVAAAFRSICFKAKILRGEGE